MALIGITAFITLIMFGLSLKEGKVTVLKFLSFLFVRWVFDMAESNFRLFKYIYVSMFTLDLALAHIFLLIINFFIR